MPPSPPPPEACLRAAELRSQSYPFRHIAELLTSEGFKCNSHETARTWARIGAEAQRYAEVLDRSEERWRLADGLDQDMASLREQVRLGLVDVLEVMPHLKWLYRERARLVGTDAPPLGPVTEDGRPIEVDPVTAAAVRLAQQRADDEVQALLNGEAS
ncbi:MAG TPA: hypothetical protein VIQ30_25745 [Pseudonocardia sp.]